jgi:hypothetical protein
MPSPRGITRGYGRGERSPAQIHPPSNREHRRPGAGFPSSALMVTTSMPSCRVSTAAPRLVAPHPMTARAVPSMSAAPVQVVGAVAVQVAGAVLLEAEGAVVQEVEVAVSLAVAVAAALRGVGGRGGHVQFGLPRPLCALCLSYAHQFALCCRSLLCCDCACRCRVPDVRFQPVLNIYGDVSICQPISFPGPPHIFVAALGLEFGFRITSYMSYIYFDKSRWFQASPIS